MSSVSIPNLPALVALTPNDLIEVVQNGVSGRATVSQIPTNLGSSTGFGPVVLQNGPSISSPSISGAISFSSGFFVTSIQGNPSASSGALYTLPPSPPVSAGYALAGNASGNLSWIPLAGAAVSTVAASYTEAATAGQGTVLVAGSAVTVTLPTAVGNTAQLTYKLTVSGTMTISASGGQKIDGSTSISTSVLNTSITIVSDNSNWWVI